MSPLPPNAITQPMAHVSDHHATIPVESLTLGPQLHRAQGVLEGVLVRHQSEDHPGAPVAKAEV